MELEELKKKYSELEKRHGLPSFSDMNKYFEIDRIDEEHEFLIRDIRKAVFERFGGFLRFSEMLLNPSGASPLFMYLLKKLTSEDRKKVEKIYESYVQLEIEFLARDISYDEKKEIQAIKKGYSLWIEMQADMNSILDVLGSGFNDVPGKKDRSYFG